MALNFSCASEKGQHKAGEEVLDLFADTWNQIIEDLRHADLISNSEMSNLTFLKLDWHESMYTHHLKPLIQPVFVFAGQVRAHIWCNKNGDPIWPAYSSFIVFIHKFPKHI